MDEGRVSRGKALRVPGQLHLAVDPVKGARLALDVDAGERGTASPDSSRHSTVCCRALMRAFALTTRAS